MIEDYALIGNLATAALVHRNGSIDWLPLPRFDSSACFAALLGSERNGRWQICPAADPADVQRRYRERTVVLETTYTTGNGRVLLTDAMSRGSNSQHVLRTVRGLEGSVPMRLAMLLTSDYGLILPRIEKRSDNEYLAVAGPDQYVAKADVAMRLTEQDEICAEFTVHAGDELSFRSLGLPRMPTSPPLRTSPRNCRG